MKNPSHLNLDPAHLAPGQEWVDRPWGWRFIFIAVGECYWLSPQENRSVSEGEIIVIAPTCFGALRASTLNSVDLYVFSLCPDLLFGFFSLAERRQLDRVLPERALLARFIPSAHPLALRYATLAKAVGTSCGGTQNRAELLSIAMEILALAPVLPSDPDKISFSARARFEQLIFALSDVEFVTYTPNELATWCDCSTRYFSKLFRDYFGASVREYRSRLRRLRKRLFSFQPPLGSHCKDAPRAIPENRTAR